MCEAGAARRWDIGLLCGWGRADLHLDHMLASGMRVLLGHPIAAGAPPLRNPPASPLSRQAPPAWRRPSADYLSHPAHIAARAGHGSLKLG